MNNIKVLYYFDSDTHFLSEIKDESVVTDDKSKIYYWLLYDKYTSNVIKLDFVSMLDNKRTFKQGELIINEYDAILKLDDKIIKFIRLQNNKKSNNMLVDILVNDILEKIK